MSRDSIKLIKRLGPVAAVAIVLGGLASIDGLRGRALDLFDDRPDRPVLFIEDPQHDFGRRKPLEVVEAALTIENRGGRTLVMQPPTASCGCQTPYLESRVLEPGERTRLVLRQEVRNQLGPFSHMIFIESNDPELPEAAIHLTGTVSVGVIVRPEPLVFGTLGFGETRQRHLEVASDDGVPFRLTFASSGSGDLVVEAPLDEPGLIHRVAVTLRAGREPGHFRESLMLNTDREGTPPLAIPVAGEVLGPITVSPSPLMLGSVTGHAEVDRGVVLSSDAGAFRVESISQEGAGWELGDAGSTSESYGTTHTVGLAIRVPNTTGLVRTDVRMDILTEDGERDSIELPIYAVVRRKP